MKKGKIMGHTYVSNLVHCVFSTKSRRNLISDNVRRRLWAYMGGIAKTHKMAATAMGGTANHVHLLLSLPGAMSIAKAVQLIKGGSSKWIHETFQTHKDFEWQEGYGAFSVSVSAAAKTVKYIENQAERHNTVTFDDEFKAFLDRHDIEYDERYVLG